MKRKPLWLILFITLCWLLCAGFPFHADARVTKFTINTGEKEYDEGIGPGARGPKFLKLNMGVRSAGMGDAFVAIGDDNSAFFFNPAGLAFLKQVELSANYLRQFGLVQHGWLAWAWPIKHKVGLASSFLYGGLAEEWQVTDIHGEPTEEEFGYDHQIYGLAIAPKIVDVLSVGFGMKQFRSNLSGRDPVGGPAFDLGVSLRPKGFRFGLALRNLGPDIEFKEGRPVGEEYSERLPRTIAVGVGYQGKDLTLSSEIDIGNEGVKIALGGEYWIGGVLAPRVGLKGYPGYGPGPRFTAGLGIRVKNFHLDYAIVSHQDLGPTHRFGTSFRFGKPPEKIKIEEKEKAIELLAAEERRLAEEEARRGDEARLRAEEEARRIAEWERQKEEARLRAEREKVPEIKVPARKFNIALLDLGAKNVSQMDAMVVRDFIQVAMVNTGAVTVVERANMDKVLAEQGFQMTGCTDRECAVEIGKILNVQKVVIGSFSKLLETYYITASIVDIERGEVEVAETAQSPSPAQLKPTAEGLARNLISKLVKK